MGMKLRSKIAADSPARIGIRIGNAGAPLEIAVFVDLCCSGSKQMFTTLFKDVYPHLEATRPGAVSFVVYHWVAPWASSSLGVNEVAIAVQRLASDKYVPFCEAI